MNPSCTAIVVARGGSVRLPGKALRPFGDSTLVGHKINTLRAVPGITSVVCGSDDEAILREAERHGALPVVRDPRCCDESRSSANEMIADMLRRIEPCGGSRSGGSGGSGGGDIILWAHPTNPLVRAETYQQAIERFLAAERRGFDSLMSVRVERRHAWHRGEPLNFHPRATRHQLASELEPVLFQDGAIFINRFESMRDRAYFYGDRPDAFPLDPIEGLDIDTPQDYEIARLLHSSEPTLPHAAAILRRLPAGFCRVAELGVAAGNLSEDLLRSHRFINLTMVDRWDQHQPGTPYHDWCRRNGDPNGVRSCQQVERDHTAALRVADQHPGRVTVLRLDTAEAAKHAGPAFDLVFIDADHSEGGCRRDIDAWWDRVRPGGWLGGHDYQRFHDDGVGRAVRSFAEPMGLAIERDQNWTWFIRKPASATPHTPHATNHIPIPEVCHA